MFFLFFSVFFFRLVPLGDLNTNNNIKIKISNVSNFQQCYFTIDKLMLLLNIGGHYCTLRPIINGFQVILYCYNNLLNDCGLWQI